MLEIGNRVVMVSGASRGLGLAVAEKLHMAGYRLSLGVRDTEAPALRDGSWDRSRVLIHRFDALATAAPRGWVEATVARFDQIDGLVTHAEHHAFLGVELGPAANEEEQEAVFDELLTANVKAPLRLIRAALPYLRKSGHGRVVNVAALSGSLVPRYSIGYPMMRAALTALSQGLRRLGWQDCLRSTILCPGVSRVDLPTDGATAFGPQLAETATLEEVAAVIDHLLRLPNTTSVAELMVGNRFDDTV
jgi:NAD(P)-dependent dehydrogenase (short-subunit alcohol dehydrogenase family)